MEQEQKKFEILRMRKILCLNLMRKVRFMQRKFFQQKIPSWQVRSEFGKLVKLLLLFQLRQQKVAISSIVISKEDNPELFDECVEYVIDFFYSIHLISCLLINDLRYTI